MNLYTKIFVFKLTEYQVKGRLLRSWSYRNECTRKIEEVNYGAVMIQNNNAQRAGC